VVEKTTRKRNAVCRMFGYPMAFLHQNSSKFVLYSNELFKLLSLWSSINSSCISSWTFSTSTLKGLRINSTTLKPEVRGQPLGNHCFKRTIFFFGDWNYYFQTCRVSYIRVSNLHCKCIFFFFLNKQLQRMRTLCQAISKCPRKSYKYYQKRPRMRRDK